MLKKVRSGKNIDPLNYLGTITLCVIFISILSGCDPDPESSVAVQTHTDSSGQTTGLPTPTTPSPIPQVLDTLSIRQVMLNGKIPFTSSPEKVISTLGPPEDVTRPMYDCGGYMEGDSLYGELVQLIHYGKTQFVIYLNKADIKQVDMEDGRFSLQTPRLLLDGNTTLESFALAYPHSAAAAYDRPVKNPYGHYKMAILIPKKSVDDQWQLTFKDGKLILVAYWIGC